MNRQNFHFKEFEWKMEILILRVKETNKTCIAKLPKLFGEGTTTWRAKPTKDGRILIKDLGLLKKI